MSCERATTQQAKCFFLVCFCLFECICCAVIYRMSFCFIRYVWVCLLLDSMSCVRCACSVLYTLYDDDKRKTYIYIYVWIQSTLNYSICLLFIVWTSYTVLTILCFYKQLYIAFTTRRRSSSNNVKQYTYTFSYAYVHACDSRWQYD